MVDIKSEVLALVIAFVVGTLIPTIIALILPRRKTISFGMAIYDLVGGTMLQKRAHNIPLPQSRWQKLRLVLRSTFADAAFGVYVASRKDWSRDQKEAKIKEYIDAVGTDLS